MPTANLTGNIRDFTGGNIAGVRLVMHPLQSSATGSNVMPDRPVAVNVSSNGSFSVPLEEQNRYRAEVTFPDGDRSRWGQSIIGEFRMPVGGGSAGHVIGPPSANGMVRVLGHAPGRAVLEQYAYDEATGDLYERTS